MASNPRNTLPFLPGNDFEDPIFCQRKKNQSLKFIDGNPYVVSTASLSNNYVEGEQNRLPTMNMTTSQLFFSSSEVSNSFKKAPKWTESNHKVLQFTAFFKESVPESSLENERVRIVRILFFLEDDTIMVNENRCENSGIEQGTLVKRHKIQHSSGGRHIVAADLLVGNEVTIYAKTMHIASCDKFTRDYYSQSLGMEQSDDESIPKDAFVLRQEAKVSHTCLAPDLGDMKRFLEYSKTGRSSVPTLQEKIATKKFLENDRRVLRFRALWDDSDCEFGGKHFLNLYYFLSDDSIEITEIIENNSGFDPFPVFLGRTQVPKVNEAGYVMPADLMIGRDLDILGRKIVLLDCDEFTKYFLQQEYGYSDVEFNPISMECIKEKALKTEIPPYNGFGTDEDSLQSWKHLIVKPPKKDIAKMIENGDDRLRYKAVFDDEESDREFLITYFLADDTLTVFEPAKRNSGLLGGKFLERGRIRSGSNPDGTFAYISAKDFYLGNVLHINGRKFRLVEIDESTIRVLLKREEISISNGVSLNLLAQVRQSLSNLYGCVSRAFRAYDKQGAGQISVDDFTTLVRNSVVDCPEQDLLALSRMLDGDRLGQISLFDFLLAILKKDSSCKLEDMVDMHDDYDVQVYSQVQNYLSESAQFDLLKNRLREITKSRPVLVRESIRKISDAAADGKIGVHEWEKLLESVFNVSQRDQVQLLTGRLFLTPQSRVDSNQLLSWI